MNRPCVAWVAWLVLIMVASGGALTVSVSKPQPAASNLKFEVSFPAAVHSGSITGRVFVMISRRDLPEPRLQSGGWGDRPPLFGVDINQLKPGEVATIDGSTLGYPLASLQELPGGDYYVQALVNVYTEFHRADGHTVWAHQDQWEGQHFNRSPGNLFSEVQKVHLDPATGFDVKLSLTKTLPPVQVPPDTSWVKHVKIPSPLLTRFWGRPMFLGAVVLLPKGYKIHPDVYYPVVYEQDHFNLDPPFGFSTEPREAGPDEQEQLRDYNVETGYHFYEAWNSDHFPRLIVVTFQHPTPFFDDSYAVNSANNGPYGDALLTELIPYLEEHFRMIQKPYARVLTGGSTGGWESLALQVFHPDFFGGTWTGYPDPIDFTQYVLTDIYTDDNAFFEPGHQWVTVERPIMRTTKGQVEVSMRQISQLEEVLGSHGRSCQQLEAWEAVYGPVGEDGYPKPLWDKRTGKIDHDVAHYTREHGYDLTDYIRENWPKIGPQLAGKLHIYVGDMDNFYLSLAVYKLEDFLKSTTNPHDEGWFAYGRPMRGHGWQPMTTPTMIRAMAEHMIKNAPRGENTSAWNYD
jgi:enterochelin esterase-like enzyme